MTQDSRVYAQSRSSYHLKDRPKSPSPEVFRDEKGMRWHAFKRFRKTWLRSQRCLEDINNFWMAHKPQTMSELYSHLHEELQLRLDEAERVGYGFVLPAPKDVSFVPNVPKSQQGNEQEVAA